VIPTLLLDEHFSPRLVAPLGDRGVLAVPVVGHPDLNGAPDDAVLAWATREGFVLVTEDVHDFTVLYNLALADQRTPAGLVFTSARRYPRRRSGMGAFSVALADLVLGGRAPGPGEIVWL
jgi:hypothetical protein